MTDQSGWDRENTLRNVKALDVVTSTLTSS